MWIFTRYGFFSIAIAQRRDGRSRRSDPEMVMVRARQRRHLDNLKARFSELAEAAIRHDPSADYRYRLIVPKSTWSQVVLQLVDEQTWSNFKSEVEQYLGSGFRDYADALHRVWAVMQDLQVNEPVRLTREMLEGIRDFCLVRYRQMQEAADYTDRIALGRAFRTWQCHFGLPAHAADLAHAISSFWYRHPEMVAALELPPEMQGFAIVE